MTRCGLSPECFCPFPVLEKLFRMGSMEVVIRKYSEGDAAGFQQVVLESVEHISRWLSWCTPDYSIDDAASWVQSINLSGRLWLPPI